MTARPQVQTLKRPSIHAVVQALCPDERATRKELTIVNAFSVLQTIAEERIREAQEQGVFDNLPGQGAPLKESDDSNIPEELRMAYHILKNAGCVPP